MRKLGLIAAATVACGALSFAGAAGAATTFGQMGIGTGGVPVNFTSDGAGGGSLSGGGSVLFTEIDRATGFATGTPFNVNFNIDADTVGGVGVFSDKVLQDFTGFFTVTVGAGGGMYGGQMLTAGTVLLRGDFTNATFTGAYGTTNATILSGANVTFTSDYLNFANASGESFELGFGSLSPALSPAAGGGFGDFSAIVNGKVDAGGDIGVGPIPEPATWAMMIAGFAMAGAAVRRRQPKLAFA